MRFGEKLRTLRKENGLTQVELAKRAGLGLKTITNYESGATYPQDRKIYSVLADILGSDPDYLHNENDDFVSMAQRRYGYRGRRGAEILVNELTGLFAGGDVAEEDMDELMFAIQQAYVDAKRRNQKYTPKKYRKGRKSKPEVTDEGGEPEATVEEVEPEVTGETAAADEAVEKGE